MIRQFSRIAIHVRCMELGPVGPMICWYHIYPILTLPSGSLKPHKSPQTAVDKSDGGAEDLGLICHLDFLPLDSMVEGTNGFGEGEPVTFAVGCVVGYA